MTTLKKLISSIQMKMTSMSMTDRKKMEISKRKVVAAKQSTLKKKDKVEDYFCKRR